MDLGQYWRGDDQRGLIMPALAELDKEGAVSHADDWPAFKAEVLGKLESNGTSGPARDELIKPLDEAVSGGADFKSLVSEMTREYEAALRQQTAKPPPPSSPEEEQENAALTAELPDLDDLATQIVMDLGPDIERLLASDPELAQVPDEDLIQWIIEDITATLDEIGKYGWEQLG